MVNNQDKNRKRSNSNSSTQSNPPLTNQAFRDFTAQVNGGEEDTIVGSYQNTLMKLDEMNASPAFIVNAILSYKEIGSIKSVIEAILKDLDEDMLKDVAIVFGVNAPETEGENLNQALNNVDWNNLTQKNVPIALVPSTFQGNFPYGRMRNEVLHSQVTKQLTRAFLRQGNHPYISVQDFDTGSRSVPSRNNDLEEKQKHIFKALTEIMLGQDDADEIGNVGGIRPLMVGGGYRPASDLVSRILERAAARRDSWPNRGLRNNDNATAFFEEFRQAIIEDMRARQTYAREVHPLLPYTPEPNLFIDALAVAYGEESGRKALKFGEGAAEFTDLAKTLAEYEMEELEEYFLKDEKGNGVQEKREIRQGMLSVAVQNNRHPIRGTTYYTDFLGLTVETDLSRIGYDMARQWTTQGRDKKSVLQTHAKLTVIVDRFFNLKKHKKDTSMALLKKYIKGVLSNSAGQLSNSPINFKEGHKIPEVDLPTEVKKKLPTGKNIMSPSISKPFHEPPDADESGWQVTTGVQPSQKNMAFYAAAGALDKQLSRLQLIMTVMLERVGSVTPMDGNCLYHAIIQSQSDPPGTVNNEAAQAMRNLAVRWALNNSSVVAEYAFNHGVNVDDLIITLSQNGNWAGDVGDLVPRIIASALNRRINIVTIETFSDGEVIQSRRHTAAPLGAGEGAQSDPIEIFLDVNQQHYTYRDPTLEEGETRTMVREVRALDFGDSMIMMIMEDLAVRLSDLRV